MKALLVSIMMLSSTVFAASVETIHVYKSATANSDRLAKKQVTAKRDAAIKALVADCEDDKGVATVGLSRIRMLTLNRVRVMAMADADVTCTK